MLEIHSYSSWESEGTDLISHLQILEGEGIVLEVSMFIWFLDTIPRRTTVTQALRRKTLLAGSFVLFFV